MIGNVVCNTGPLIALSILDRLSFLQQLFISVSIPKEVHLEIIEGGREQAGIAAYKQANWIKVVNLSQAIDPLLTTSLDSGEAAVICLANEISPDFVIIDERKARKIARSVYGLNVIGTARILIEAKHSGLIDNVGTEIQALRDFGYFLSDNIIEITLKQAGEEKLPK